MVQILQDRQTDRHTDNDRLSQLVCTFPKTHFCIISSVILSRSQRSLILTYASMYTCVGQRKRLWRHWGNKGVGHKGWG